MIGIPVLSYKQQLVLVCQRRDTDSARMIDNLSFAGFSVRGFGVVDVDLEDPSVVYIVAFDSGFFEFHCFDLLLLQ